MFNPNYGLLTVQKEVNSHWRTIVQSVLTKDLDLYTQVDQLIASLDKLEPKELTAKIPLEVLQEKESYFTCDNIENAPNYKTPDDLEITRKLYSDFLHHYLGVYSQPDQLIPDEILIGLNYTSVPFLEEEQRTNTYIPRAPASYSDKTDEKVGIMKPELEFLASEKTVISKERPINKSQKFGLNQLKIKGLNYLTYQDAIEVAVLEGKSYQGNDQLLVYLHNLENALIAKDINNVSKKRPNLSLKWADNQGVVKGYLLAWEGKKDKEEEAEPIIYFYDLAADPKSTKAGGSLIKGFIGLYKSEYIDQNNFTPIYAEARKTTSYPILIRQAEKLARELDLELIIDEETPFMIGQDEMVPITIRLSKKMNQLNF